MKMWLKEDFDSRLDISLLWMAKKGWFSGHDYSANLQRGVAKNITFYELEQIGAIISVD